MLTDFISLVYPETCYLCLKKLSKLQPNPCLKCQRELPVTNFHLEPENPIQKLFFSKIAVHSSTAYYYFTKGGLVQQLIHSVKYKNQKELGVFIGTLFGNELIQSTYFNDVEYILPVPLHPNKLIQRGYNQSECIAMGISKSMNIPVKTNWLYRKEHQDSQTRKSHFDRWVNVSSVFEVQKHEIKGTRFLLVDDVITTGSTIESCVQAILNAYPEAKVSVAALAHTV